MIIHLSIISKDVCKIKTVSGMPKAAAYGWTGVIQADRLLGRRNPSAVLAPPGFPGISNHKAQSISLDWIYIWSD